MVQIIFKVSEQKVWKVIMFSIKAPVIIFEKIAGAKDIDIVTKDLKSFF